MSRILVIEDNAAFRELLIDWLTLKNFSVIGAGDGLTGLQLITEERPDLVICDLNMQGLDGFSVLQALRYNPLTSRTPFLLMTGTSGKNAEAIYAQAQQMQADGFLEKSRIWSQLVGAIKSCLKQPVL